jgi:hypothetical protein
MATIPPDLPRTTLAVLFIVGLIAASLWILRPFLPALIWATMVVVATWPIMLRVEQALWGRRSLAVTVMTVAMLLVFVIPFSLAIGTIVANAAEIAGWAGSLGAIKLPAPPDWLQGVPLVGRKAASAWREFTASGPEDLSLKLAPYARDVGGWLLAEVGSFGAMTVKFLLAVVIAAITSCTNTSNPSVMIGAGLLAKRAVERGLRVNSVVKTSLAPGSRVVSDYLQKTGLQTYLDQLGFIFSRFIDTNAEIKTNKMRMIIFAGNLQVFRNSVFGKFFKFRIGDSIHDTFTGIQHFFCKILWYKDRCFRHTKLNGAGVNRIQLV